jgi:hypothetical protein
LIGQATTVVGVSSFLTVACPVMTQALPVLGAGVVVLAIPTGAIACGAIALAGASIAAWGNPDYKIHFSLGAIAVCVGVGVAIGGVIGVVAIAGLSVFGVFEYRRQQQIHLERLSQNNQQNNQIQGKTHGY